MYTIPADKVLTAERARQKAEARRRRILAKSAQRLDVVNGFEPSASVAAAPKTVADGGSVAAGSSKASKEAPPAPAVAADAPDAAGSAAPRQSATQRRMAAARRRRYKTKTDAKEVAAADESGGAPAAASKEEERVEDKKDEVVNTSAETTAKEIDVAEKAVEVKKEEPAEAAVESNPAEPASEVKATPDVTIEKEATPAAKEEEEKENQPANTAKPSTTTTTIDEKKEDEEPKKKYMGVARMRRKRLKEKKVQRLKDIADAEIVGHDSGADLERELVAEMATMDITASMVRNGGMGVDANKANLTGTAKKSKKSWFSKFIPPVKLMPRMVTLLLLFFAGLDLGTQPHRSAGSPLADAVAPSMARDLAGSDAAVGLIQHAEPALTKPWEYGMGGKVAYMVGMAPSSPPTAMPTSFDADTVCNADDPTNEACSAPSSDNKQSKEKTITSKEDKGGKKKKKGIKVQLMEDEFDNNRGGLPRGASHDEEFADDSAVPKGAPNIDPLFQVDLDALCANANLPFPIDFCAKCAIGFHRAWVYYLWTLPASLVKSAVQMPKNLLSGWISNPPWILGVVLVIRFLAKVLAGNGRSAFSLEPDKDDAEAKDDGGGGGKFAVMTMVTDTAKNYVKSKFPRIVYVLSTLMSVMKVDMYVVLCGMLIGLVGPLAKEDFIAWSESSGQWFKPTLGDDEL